MPVSRRPADRRRHQKGGHHGPYGCRSIEIERTGSAKPPAPAQRAHRRGRRRPGLGRRSGRHRWCVAAAERGRWDPIHIHEVPLHDRPACGLACPPGRLREPGHVRGSRERMPWSSSEHPRSPARPWRAASPRIAPTLSIARATRARTVPRRSAGHTESSGRGAATRRTTSAIHAIHDGRRHRLEVSVPTGSEALAGPLLEQLRQSFAFTGVEAPSVGAEADLAAIEAELQGTCENAWHPPELEFATIEAAGLTDRRTAVLGLDGVGHDPAVGRQVRRRQHRPVRCSRRRAAGGGLGRELPPARRPHHRGHRDRDVQPHRLRVLAARRHPHDGRRHDEAPSTWRHRPASTRRCRSRRCPDPAP